MRLKIFLSSFVPYLAVISITIFIFVRFGETVERNLFRDIVRQEHNRLEQDIVNVLEREEESQAIITAIVERYRMGNYIYAWLIDKNGREIAFSQNKRYIDPGSLVFDKKNILPYILSHLPGGEMQFSTGKWRKYIKYSEISGTEFILAIVSSAPAENLQRNSLYSGIWLGLTGLFILGIIWSLLSSELLSRPLSRIASFANQVSLEQEPDSPKIASDPEINITISALERIRNILSERKVTDQNPLTNLPGNIALEKQLFDAIDSKERFAVGETNVFNFSSYNHRYGFKRGDSVIRFIGSSIQSILQEIGEKDDFVAHLGGDRFVFVTRSSEPDKISNRIIRTFDDHIRLYYDEKDREKGYVVSKNRRGEIQKFPVVSLLIGVATNFKRPLIHPLQIAHVTSEILEYLRQYKESAFLIDRRLTDREPAPGEEAHKDMLTEEKAEAPDELTEVELTCRKEYSTKSLDEMSEATRGEEVAPEENSTQP